MKNALSLIGPSVMIFTGLQLFGNVIITFLLFYGWLLSVPLIDKNISKGSFAVSKTGLVWGIASGLLFFVFIYGGLTWLHNYFLDIDQLRVLLLEWGFSGDGEVWLVLILVFVNPILEEVYWRGYMYEKLKGSRKVKGRILMTAAFYTLYHFLSAFPIFQGLYSLAAVIPVFITGLFWGILREKTGSITISVISHLLGDLGIVCVYWFIVR